MTPDPQPRRPTIIPESFDDEEDAQPALHRAATVMEGYRPPSPPEAPPEPKPVVSQVRGSRREARRSDGFLGMGMLADVVFGVLLSVVFASGIGIGAALVMP